MDKKYTEFMDEISPDELYEGLLAYGFFAEKLPPVFTAVPFFDYCKTITDGPCGPCRFRYSGKNFRKASRIG